MRVVERVPGDGARGVKQLGDRRCAGALAAEHVHAVGVSGGGRVRRCADRRPAHCGVVKKIGTACRRRTGEARCP